jgi:hypothetical protein
VELLHVQTVESWKPMIYLVFRWIIGFWISADWFLPVVANCHHHGRKLPTWEQKAEGIRHKPSTYITLLEVAKVFLGILNRLM